MPNCKSVGTSHSSTYWLNIEPCGFVCGMMTWVLLAYGMYTTTFAVIEPWLGFGLHGLFHTILFNSTCLIAMYCHYAAMTTDPGAVPKEARPLPSDDQEFDPESMRDSQQKYKKYCRRCKAFKPRRAHHCSICERCILKMDHHCPWVNNCVGLGNHKLFMLFLFWVFVVSVYALILITAKFMSCSLRRSSKHYCGSPNGKSILVVMLLVEAILFGLFTLCMMADQSESISTNQTQIDRLKKEKYEIQTEINEVFGTPADVSFSWSWFVPIPARFPREFFGAIYGYALPKCISDLDHDDEENDSELMPLTRPSARGELRNEDAGQDKEESMESMDSESTGFKERLLPSSSFITSDYNKDSSAPVSAKAAGIDMEGGAVDTVDVGAGLGMLGRAVRSNSGSSNGSMTSVGERDRDGGREKSRSLHPSVRKRVSAADPNQANK